MKSEGVRPAAQPMTAPPERRRPPGGAGEGDARRLQRLKGHQSMTQSRDVPVADYRKAMRLLGLEPEHPEYALVSVHIEDGKIEARYAEINNIRNNDGPLDESSSNAQAPCRCPCHTPSQECPK